MVVYVVNRYPDFIKGSPFALVLRDLGGSRCPPAKHLNQPKEETGTRAEVVMTPPEGFHRETDVSFRQKDHTATENNFLLTEVS